MTAPWAESILLVGVKDGPWPTCVEDATKVEYRFDKYWYETALQAEANRWTEGFDL